MSKTVLVCLVQTAEIEVDVEVARGYLMDCHANVEGFSDEEIAEIYVALRARAGCPSITYELSIHALQAVG